MTTENLLEQAVNLDLDKSNLPDPAQIVTALLKLEKDAKKQKNLDYSDLIGCWNLRFITGTKKTRNRAGVILGAGKYIPRFISIKITYEGNELLGVGDRQSDNNTGRVKNSVKLASIELSLTGPTKLLDGKSIMAFDFTTIKIAAFGFMLYDGYIRNGKAREARFYHQTIKEQAFFNYFYVSENVIAARGKGGGLAVWGRDYKR